MWCLLWAKPSSRDVDCPRIHCCSPRVPLSLSAFCSLLRPLHLPLPHPPPPQRHPLLPLPLPLLLPLPLPPHLLPPTPKHRLLRSLHVRAIACLLACERCADCLCCGSDREILIDDCEPHIWLRLLECIYTDKVTLTPEDVGAVCELAKKYQVSGRRFFAALWPPIHCGSVLSPINVWWCVVQVDALRAACSKFLRQNIDVKNACTLLMDDALQLSDSTHGLSPSLFAEHRAQH
jgi:hypothetical protein